MYASDPTIYRVRVRLGVSSSPRGCDYKLLPDESWTLGGTESKDTQSDGVFGRRPMRLIL